MDFMLAWKSMSLVPQKYEKVARQGGFRIFSDCESMKCKAIWSIMLETAINDRIILKK